MILISAKKNMMNYRQSRKFELTITYVQLDSLTTINQLWLTRVKEIQEGHLCANDVKTATGTLRELSVLVTAAQKIQGGLKIYE